jgi:hypothetical protein
VRESTCDGSADCRNRAAGRSGQHGSTNRGRKQSCSTINAIRLRHLRA